MTFSRAAAVLAAAFLLCPAVAFAQGAVLQAGPVTPGHSAVWARNGIIRDGGTQTIIGGTIGTPCTQSFLDTRGGKNTPFYTPGGPGRGDYITLLPEAPGQQLAQFTRCSSLTNDLPQIASQYYMNHTGGTGNIHFNDYVRSYASNYTTDGLWNFLASTYTTSGVPSVFGSGSSTQVGAYLQAVRWGIDDPVNRYGVPLEAAVVEYHDFVDQPTSIKGFGIGLEVDFAANNVDDAGTQSVINIIPSQANPAGSDLIVGNGLAVFGSQHAYFHRVINMGATPFDQAGIDFRNTTQLSGANAIWLKDGETIAFDALGSNKMFYDSGAGHVQLNGALNVSGILSTNTGLSVFGHVTFQGAQPAVSACGIDATISGADNKFHVHPGTGAPTSCTVTFQTAFPAAPYCVVSTSDPTINGAITAVSNTSVTLGFSAGMTGKEAYAICIQ